MSIRVVTATAHECCDQIMVMQREVIELCPDGVLFEATHVCLTCGLSLNLSALVPHARVHEVRGRRAPGGREVAATP